MFYIINDALYLVGHKLKIRGITVEVTVSPDLKIYCDPQKISQVFVNLFDNACDAVSDEKGKITIDSNPLNDHLSISIRDNGPGIPEEIADRIFEPFFTTKHKDGNPFLTNEDYICYPIHKGNMCYLYGLGVKRYLYLSRNIF